MKRIAVWGTEDAATKFLLTHKDIEVKYFIESKKMCRQFWGGKRTITQNELLSEQTEYIVVASSEDVYWEIRKTLLNMGLEEFQDFCYWELFEKKIAVIYGNCHTTAIKLWLQQSNEFNNEYGFYPLRPIQNINNDKLDDLESTVFENCDLFIHQSIRDDNPYGIRYASKNIIKALKNDCSIIAVPNLYGLPKFLYPQTEADLNPKLIEGKNYYPFRDKYLEKELRSKKSIDETVSMILYSEITSKSEINNSKDTFFDKIKIREKDWDVEISDWMYEELSNLPLFYDQNHPTNEVIKYIANAVLRKLGYKEVYIDIGYRMDSFEIPTYGDVCHKLGLNYSTQNILRQYSKHSLQRQVMTLEQYVYEYFLWYS